MALIKRIFLYVVEGWTKSLPNIGNSTAVANKLIMVTDNIKDFNNIKGIKIENWIEHK